MLRRVMDRLLREPLAQMHPLVPLAFAGATLVVFKDIPAARWWWHVIGLPLAGATGVWFALTAWNWRTRR